MFYRIYVTPKVLLSIFLLSLRLIVFGTFHLINLKVLDKIHPNAFAGAALSICCELDAFPTRHHFTRFLRTNPVQAIVQKASSVACWGWHVPRIYTVRTLKIEERDIKGVLFFTKKYQTQNGSQKKFV